MKYETPILEIVILEEGDVIRTSSLTEGDPDQPITGGGWNQ